MNPDFTNFFGTFTPRLDDKGRLFLPAKFRPRLDSGLVLTKGQENCIFGWTLESFEELTARLRALPFTNKQGRAFVRMFFSSASQEQPDKQGRIQVPAMLREWAQIDRDCTVIGAADRFEIWSPQRWATFSEQEEAAFSDMSDEVIPGIF